MSLTAYQFAQVSDASVNWRLRRNCSVTPGQLLQVYLMLSVFSLAIGIFFWFQGAPFVIGFAGLELLLVGWAFLVYARHATDGEWISLQGPRLVVERESAGRRERAEFERQWVRVEPQADERSLIELSGRGRKMQVGRFVRPEPPSGFGGGNQTGFAQCVNLGFAPHRHEAVSVGSNRDLEVCNNHEEHFQKTGFAAVPCGHLRGRSTGNRCARSHRQ